MIRRALLLFALFLATPAIVGAFDAWAFVMIGRTLLVEWDGGRNGFREEKAGSNGIA